MNLREIIQQAKKDKIAIGHFNVSNLEMFKGVLGAVQEYSKIKEKQTPVFIGLSENERKYIGSAQTIAFVQNFRAETNYPVFICADHCHTQKSAEEATREGFDLIVIDNSRLPLEENIKATKRTVDILKGIRLDVLTEGEIGFIGGSSKLLDEIPEKVDVSLNQMTKVDEAKRFIMETGVDLFAPVVGNIHGVLKNFNNPQLNTQRIQEIAKEVEVPLVLHGGSGVADGDIEKAVDAGISVIHFSTDLRVAFRSGLQDLVENYFPNHPNEVAPYKIMQLVIKSVQDSVFKKIKLLN